MSDRIKIVILGAGYGGVHTAKKLSKKYKKNNNVEITLIDRNPFHTLMTELHEVAGGRVDKESVMVDLRTIFHGSKVNIITENIEKVDIEGQKVTTEYNTYQYDYLVVGTGSETAYFGVPGVKENGFSLWSLEDALTIREHIENMFKAASKERNDSRRKELLTLIVAGAGFTGIETIGELMEWKTRLSKEHNVDEKEVRLMVVEAMPSILNMLNKDQAGKVERYMAKKGIELMKNAPIVEVTPNLVKLKDGTEIPSRTLIWTCGIQGNAEASELNLEMGKRGRLQTNKYMQSVSKENIFVVGDIAWYEENGKPTPQIVEAAMQTGETVAKNIEAAIEKKEKVEFKSNYHGFMVSVGGRYGVADVGGMKLSGFFAMAMKHLVNMHYLFGIGGFLLIYNYLCHEFFYMKDERSIMRGHLAARSSTLWLVVLRLYIGTMWVIEGVTKISQGWLSPEHIYIVSTTNVSGASQQAAEGAAQAANTVVPLLANPPAFYTAFMNTFIAPYAYFFQVTIVLGEVAIGLALLAGLFTFLASAGSIFLCFNFILSAMGGKEILWYIFGAVALMGGAGRAFGLDYYVIPWFWRTFGKIAYGKRKPIYTKDA
mgnify:CR=1 FL=1